MKAYSLDLRERVAAACQQSGRTIGAVAAQCSVSVSSVAKLLQRQRRSGSLAPLPLRGGPAPCLDASSRADVVACLRQQPKCHLGRVARVAGRARGPRREPGDDGPCRAGQAVGWLRKKRASTPPNATPSGLGALRAAFVEAVQAEDVTCFKSVDNTSTNLTYGRRYARAEGEQRAHQVTPLHGGPNVTLVAALTPTVLER